MAIDEVTTAEDTIDEIVINDYKMTIVKTTIISSSIFASKTSSNLGCKYYTTTTMTDSNKHSSL